MRAREVAAGVRRSRVHATDQDQHSDRERHDGGPGPSGGARRQGSWLVASNSHTRPPTRELLSRSHSTDGAMKRARSRAAAMTAMYTRTLTS